MRNPIMNNRPSADCGICAKKPYRFPSSVFMLLPLFCDCLHSILPLACYYTINYAVAYVPGSFWDFPAPRRGAVATGIPRPKAVREADALAGVRDPPVVFRGSGLCLCSRWLRPGGGSSLPPADVNAPLRNTTNYTKSAAPESSATAMLPIHAVRPTLRPEHMKRHYQTCRQRHPASHRASLFSSQTLTLNHAYHFRDFSCRHKAFRVWRRGEVRRTAAKVSRGRRRRNRRRNRRRRLPQGNPPRRQLSCPARRAIQQTACRHGVALGVWGE